MPWLGAVGTFCRRLPLPLILGAVGAHASAVPSPYTANCTFESIAGKYGLRPHLVVAIAKQESGLNPRAIGPRNADGLVDIGLMQVIGGDAFQRRSTADI